MTPHRTEHRLAHMLACPTKAAEIARCRSTVAFYDSLAAIGVHLRTMNLSAWSEYLRATDVIRDSQN